MMKTIAGVLHHPFLKKVAILADPAIMGLCSILSLVLSAWHLSSRRGMGSIMAPMPHFLFNTPGKGA
jgi:hypothetical protein